MNRFEIIEELRKHTDKRTLDMLLKHSTASLVTLLAFYKSERVRNLPIKFEIELDVKVPVRAVKFIDIPLY